MQKWAYFWHSRPVRWSIAKSCRCYFTINVQTCICLRSLVSFEFSLSGRIHANCGLISLRMCNLISQLSTEGFQYLLFDCNRCTHDTRTFWRCYGWSNILAREQRIEVGQSNKAFQLVLRTIINKTDDFDRTFIQKDGLYTVCLSWWYIFPCFILCSLSVIWCRWCVQNRLSSMITMKGHPIVSAVHPSCDLWSDCWNAQAYPC